jgi:hypothetical protein
MRPYSPLTLMKPGAQAGEREEQASMSKRGEPKITRLLI